MDGGGHTVLVDPSLRWGPLTPRVPFRGSVNPKSKNRSEVILFSPIRLKTWLYLVARVLSRPASEGPMKTDWAPLPRRRKGSKEYTLTPLVVACFVRNPITYLS